MPKLRRRRRAQHAEVTQDQQSFLAVGITADPAGEWGKFWDTPPADIPADVLSDMEAAWHIHQGEIFDRYSGVPALRPLWAERVFEQPTEGVI